jgi:hypothetical protein
MGLQEGERQSIYQISHSQWYASRDENWWLPIMSFESVDTESWKKNWWLCHDPVFNTLVVVDMQYISCAVPSLGELNELFCKDVAHFMYGIYFKILGPVLKCSSMTSCSHWFHGKWNIEHKMWEGKIFTLLFMLITREIPKVFLGEKPKVK